MENVAILFAAASVFSPPAAAEMSHGSYDIRSYFIIAPERSQALIPARRVG